MADSSQWDPTGSSLTPDSFTSNIRNLGERSADTAVSPKGARSSMQVMPGTSVDPGYGVAPAKDSSLEELNRVGVDYSKAMFAHYDGNPVLASAAYNAGPGKVDQWIKQFGDPRTGAISNEDWVARIPVDETRAYAKRVAGGSLGQVKDIGATASYQPQAPSTDGTNYPNWQAAARGGNLASYAWSKMPGMGDLVPGYSPDEGLGQKMLDWGSLPARLATNALIAPVLEGGQAYKDWMAGNQGPETRRAMTSAVIGTGMNGMALSRPPTGSLGVFAGPRSATASFDKLDRAQSMWEKGLASKVPQAKLQDQVFNETGWYKDADQKWKYEVPDNFSQVAQNLPKVADWSPLVRLPRGDEPGAGDMRLGQVLDHQDMYAAYPWMQHIPVRPLSYSDQIAGVKGALTHDNQILLGANTPEELHATLLHEAQHVIQREEGFAGGGSTSEFLPENWNAAMATSKAQLHEMFKTFKDAGVDPMEFDQVSSRLTKAENPKNMDPKDLQFMHDTRAKIAQVNGVPQEQADDFLFSYRQQRADERKLIIQYSAANLKYKMLAGEIESRNVEERFANGYGAETHPMATPGYPRGKQSVRFEPGNPRFTVEPVEHDPFTTSVTPVDHDPFATNPLGDKQ